LEIKIKKDKEIKIEIKNNKPKEYIKLQKNTPIKILERFKLIHKEIFNYFEQK